MARPAPAKSHPPKSPRRPGPNVVQASWLLKTLGGMFLFALACSYLSLCLLYHQGQWQIVLHPDAAARSATPPQGLLHFGPDETGRPQLTGELWPAGEGSHYGRLTILLLPAGDGSRADLAATVQQLHDLGLSVFSFDYRGYGLSALIRPNQQQMTEDAEAAWRYLNVSHGVPAAEIVPYGVGVGASLAVTLAERHPATPAVILDHPLGDLLATAQRDPRSRFVPTELLFKQRFPLAGPLATLKTPKLLIMHSDSSKEFIAAANPKMSVELSQQDLPHYAEAIRRFLDQYSAH